MIIEIQKAKFASDIMRFRNYLGGQYTDKNNTYKVIRNKREQKKALPIVSIYFLGHKLEKIHGIPVIKVERQYIDISNGNVIGDKEDFIESLSHDSYVIQIPELENKRRNELERLLSVFDQSTCSENDHILEINEEDFPGKYDEIIRRLQKAALEPNLRKNMDLEDQIIEELQDKEREIVEKEKIIEEKEKIIEENKKELEEKDKALEDNKKELEEKDKALKEKERLIEEMRLKLAKLV